MTVATTSYSQTGADNLQIAKSIQQHSSAHQFVFMQKAQALSSAVTLPIQQAQNDPGCEPQVELSCSVIT